MKFQFARFNNWWLYKIPPLLSIGYALLLINQISLQSSWASVLGVLISLTSVAIYGHIINDIFDIEEDQLRGKPNAFVEKSLKTKNFLVTLFVLSGFIPPLILRFSKTSIFLLLINYLLPTAYSIPPIRLKEKGVWGLIFDAAGVHAIPTLFVGIIISSISLVDSQPYIWLAIAVCWAFVFGLRGIISHQVLDRDNDLLGEVETFVAKTDVKQIDKFVNRILFPLEIFLLLILLGGLFEYFPVILIVVIVYTFLEVGRFYVSPNRSLGFLASSSGKYVIPGDFYEVWLPITLIGSLIAFDSNYWFLLLFHIALFFKRVQIHLVDTYKGFRKLFFLA